MKRLPLMLAVVALVACTTEPTAVNSLSLKAPVYTMGSSSAGGVSFASGSGCSLVLQHFECGYTLDGVGTDLYQISEAGTWTYQYQCVNRKTFKTSRKYPVTNSQITTTVRYSMTGVAGEIVHSGTILTPDVPSDCASNKGAFTLTAVVNGFHASSWSIYAFSDTDATGHYASIYETL